MPVEVKAAQGTVVNRAMAAGGVDPRSGGFEIALGEWALSPEARAIRPGPVTFVIRNRGKFRHGLELEVRRVDDRHGGDRHGDDHGDDDAKSIRLSPGEATRMTLNLAPGVYEIECFVSHHDELGMRGVLEVRADAPLVKPPAASRSAVEISGFAFKPATLKTTVGKTVTWRNADAAPHTATASRVLVATARQGCELPAEVHSGGNVHIPVRPASGDARQGRRRQCGTLIGCGQTGDARGPEVPVTRVSSTEAAPTERALSGRLRDGRTWD